MTLRRSQLVTQQNIGDIGNEKRDNKQCLLNTPRRVTAQKLFFHNNNSLCKCPMGVHHVGMISNFSIKNCGRS